MILKRQNMSENNWNHFKIVPKGHNHCQLSTVNCQFGEAAKFQFIDLPARPVQAVSHIIPYLISHISYLIYIIVSPPSGTPFRAPPEGFSFTGFCYKFYPVSARNFYLQKEENP